ncbi:MAG TPA: Hsp70 family protein [Polyangiaceae bacterium]|nr:Hsp70 family protein [Polyangiaceae bacterium]
MQLGIDFGTTRTVVAYADRGNYPVAHFVDRAGDACDHFPSVVAGRDGELRFGFDALEAAAAEPGWELVRSFKRLLADASASAPLGVAFGGGIYSAPELVARFLGALREAIFRRSNVPAALLAPGRASAVVASPANAHGTQRFVTLEAFRHAGFEVLAMLNEPSAAGFEYTHRHGATLTGRRDHVVVYDLGGGTFDASLVRVRGRHHEALTTAGLNRLGGDDFDDVLLDLVLERAGLRRSALAPAALRALTDQCRDVKERLHPNSRRLAVDLEAALGRGAPCPAVTLEAGAFYEASAFLVERTIEAMLPVVGRLDEESPREGAVGDDVAGIYVVGGGSCLPSVARALRQRFGRRVHRSPQPSAAIAIGLAIASDRGAGYTLSDRFSRTFGVFRDAEGGERAVFDPLFGRDLPLPRPGEAPVTLRRTYRALHNVGCYRFGECADVDAGGTPLGQLTPYEPFYVPFDPALRGRPSLAKVPVVRRAEGPLVEEAYAVDEHGVVSVRIADLDTGFALTRLFGAPLPKAG